MSIGERIIALRKQQNISQSDLARYLDVSRQAVSKWETDRSSPDTLKLIRLSELLDTDVEYLATGRKLKVSESGSSDGEESAPLSPAPPQPIVVNLVHKVVETREKIVEKPVIRRKIRIRYRTNPYIVLLWCVPVFLMGILVGLMLS